MKRISNSLTRGLCVRLHCSSLAHFNITSPHPYASAPARGEAISRVSTLGSMQSLTEYQMPPPPSETSLKGVNITWSGPTYPSFYSTSKIGVSSPPPSPTSKDAIKMLIESVLSMMEHLPSGREVLPPPSVSPPLPSTNWANWSNAMGREMYLCRVLNRLNLEYPSNTTS